MYQLSTGAPKPASVDVPVEFEWSRIWRAFLQRRKLFGTIFFGTFAVIVAYTFLTPRVYTTHVKLIAGGGGNGVQGGATATVSTLPLLNAILAANGVQSSETYAELFQEQPVAEQVIRDQHLDMNAATFLSHVKIKPIVNTSLLDLAVSWNDRDKSAQIANAFAGAFVDRERALVASQADDAIRVLGKQVPAAQVSASRTQTALTTFQARNNLADIVSQTKNTIDAASTIDGKIAAAQVDRQQAQAQLSTISAELRHVGPMTGGATSVAPNPVLAGLQTQLAQATVSLQGAQQQYTDQHPTVIGLKRQVADLRRQIAATPATVVAQSNTMPNPMYQQLSQQAATFRAQIASDNAQLAQLEQQRTTMRPQISSLPAKAARFLELQRQAKLAQDVLTALQQKLNEANISKATALGDVTITQPADAASAIASPNRLLNILVGLVLSFVLAAVATLLFYAFDRRIRDATQIEDDLELPVLASVPTLSSLQHRLPGPGGHVVSLPANSDGAEPAPQEADEPWVRAHAVEAFLGLVTSLRYSATSDRPMRVITVTSPEQGDGKSTVALNAAITMAHLQPRVLLIDGDLRRPSLHAKLERELGRGLSDVLVGTTQLNDAIVPTQHEGLDLLTSGTRTPNSVKLIQSQRFDDLLAGLLERYSTIIIDAPALTPVIDAAILAAKSDGTVMVVSIGKTDGVAVKRAIRKMNGLGATNLIGTVANRTQPVKRGIYDDYLMMVG